MRELEAEAMSDEQRLSEIDAYLVGFPPASINPRVIELAKKIRQHADDLVKRYTPPPRPPEPTGPMASMDAADVFSHEVA